MSDAGVIFLIHQGYSFINDLISLSDRLGLKSFVLCSKIPGDATKRIEELRGISTVFKETDSLALSNADVELFLKELREKNFQPLGSLSVWEGYRLLMARLNQKLGACDLKQETLRLLLDKYALRNRLFDLGLSHIKTENLDLDYLPVWDGRPRFVKPRSGLGSFAAFLWQGESLKEKLNGLINEMKVDTDYVGVFSERLSFVAEDEIKGKEYSFEVNVKEGEAAFLAIHEKLDLQMQFGSVLENACASPPVSLSENDHQAGVKFVDHVLQALEISTGCFHIEARFDGCEWEIIEINPRIGGAYIYQSTKWVSGKCLLRIWLETILSSPTTTPLEKNVTPRGRSFFRVFFGNPGKSIKSIKYNTHIQPPQFNRQIISAGITLPNSSREIFVGQALWLMDSETPAKDVQKLQYDSIDFMEITYA